MAALTIAIAPGTAVVQAGTDEPEPASVEVRLATADGETLGVLPSGVIIELTVDGEGGEPCLYTTGSPDLPDGCDQILTEENLTAGAVTASVQGLPDTKVTVAEEDGRRIVTFAPSRSEVVQVREIRIGGDLPSEGAVEIVQPTTGDTCGAGVINGGTLLIVVDRDTTSCVNRFDFGLRVPGQDDLYDYDLPADIGDGSAQFADAIELSPELVVFGRGGGVVVRQADGGSAFSAQEGLGIEFSTVDGTSCGGSTVNDNNAYAAELAYPCQQGDDSEAVASIREAADLQQTLALGEETQLDVEFVAPPDQTFVMGSATTDGAPLESGRELLFEIREPEYNCGSATVQSNGAYIVLLDEQCSAADALAVSVRNAELTSTLTPSPEAPVQNIALADGGDTGEPPSENRESSLLEDYQIFWLLMSLIVLVVLALWMFWWSSPAKADAQLTRAVAKRPEEFPPELVNSLREREAQRTQLNFAPAFLFALLVVVTVALVTLTLGGTLTEQGALTILGAIVGYAAGRGSAGSG